MQIFTSTPDEYVRALPPERQEVIEKLRTVIKANLPEGYEECMSYGMIGYVVPFSIYPQGYHCKPPLPLPFVNIASQKNNVSLYHTAMGADPDLLDWWKKSYKKAGFGKLDMGVGCIRFKKLELIPYELIGELMKRITPAAWIKLYESRYRNKK